MKEALRSILALGEIKKEMALRPNRTEDLIALQEAQYQFLHHFFDIVFQKRNSSPDSPDWRVRANLFLIQRHFKFEYQRNLVWDVSKDHLIAETIDILNRTLNSSEAN